MSSPETEQRQKPRYAPSWIRRHFPTWLRDHPGFESIVEDHEQGETGDLGPKYIYTTKDRADMYILKTISEWEDISDSDRAHCQELLAAIDAQARKRGKQYRRVAKQQREAK